MDLADDGLEDGRRVLELGEVCRERLDGAQASGQLRHGAVQPGVLDRHRHLVGEVDGEGELEGRPGVRPVVIEDQQSQTLVAEDDRHQAGRLQSVGEIGVAKRTRELAVSRVVHDERDPLPRRAQSHCVVVPFERAHRAYQARAQPTLRREPEGVPPGLDQPESDPLRIEQGAGVLDHVFEQQIEVELAADVGRDAVQRLGPADERTRSERNGWGDGPASGLQRCGPHPSRDSGGTCVATPRYRWFPGAAMG